MSLKNSLLLITMTRSSTLKGTLNGNRMGRTVSNSYFFEGMDRTYPTLADHQ